MKNLQFKLDMIGSALGCIGILLLAYALIELSWIAYFGTLLAMVGCVIVTTSGRITRFIERKDNGEENNSD